MQVRLSVSLTDFRCACSEGILRRTLNEVTLFACNGDIAQKRKQQKYPKHGEKIVN